jgi:hypothetical protein
MRSTGVGTQRVYMRDARYLVRELTCRAWKCVVASRYSVAGEDLPLCSGQSD